MSETKNVDAYGEQQTTTGCSTRVVIMPFFSVVICYQNGHGALETNASALFLLLRQVCLQQTSSAHTLEVLLCMFASLYDLEGERVDKMGLLVSSSSSSSSSSLAGWSRKQTFPSARL